jgi:DNA polymerase-3 subunit gamma/tau|tara:strand:- start:450 stop:2252 length:1803 start_codon:yes stop_codon:yes gene_type:complete
MTYQVLARKWRPRIFSEMAGQEHVLRTLINALEQDRLHHAYLFTGTRGVGKTTIARILAKCLNCEMGVSSTPCETCSACISISEGRFLDLIEVDAASKTKVDDTRELLENVQYAPSVGRFKVYLIDEVHMLSTHSFNALLKTLEEPPAHVKFLFATTDPQKLPVTILSRCLQFNLKNISPEVIVGHLKYILGEEKINYEEPGLWLLARAADGSMRDALSLTDQAVSYCGGKLTDADVSDMLGSVNLMAIEEITRALINRDSVEVIAAIQKMSELAPDYSATLGALLSLFHRVAIAQVAPAGIDNNQGDKSFVLEVSEAVSSEDVQLFYQIALLGRRDLPLAPEPRVGFEMVMLRMLAFSPPQETGIEPPVRPKTNKMEKSTDSHDANLDIALNPKRMDDQEKKGEQVKLGSDVCESELIYSDEVPLTGNVDLDISEAGYSDSSTQLAEDLVPPEPICAEPEIRATSIKKVSLDNFSKESWIEVYDALTLGGVLQNIAANLALVDSEGPDLSFVLDETESALYDPKYKGRIALELSAYFDTAVNVTINIGIVASETPQLLRIKLQKKKIDDATQSLQSDRNVHDITNVLDGVLLKNTIKVN